MIRKLKKEFIFTAMIGVSIVLIALLGTLNAINIHTIYFIVRIFGKYIGAFIGCLLARKPKETRNYFGLALIPQAGVAIGLAALGARTLGGDMGNALETIILASSVLYELIGPACAKLSLYLSKSYTTKLEELIPLDETQASTVPPNAVDELIERIRIIQQELKNETISAEEKAFTEAAEQHLESIAIQHSRLVSGGKRK